MLHANIQCIYTIKGWRSLRVSDPNISSIKERSRSTSTLYKQSRSIQSRSILSNVYWSLLYTYRREWWNVMAGQAQIPQATSAKRASDCYNEKSVELERRADYYKNLSYSWLQTLCWYYFTIRIDSEYWEYAPIKCWVKGMPNRWP